MKTNPSHSMDDLLVKCILDEANKAERETVNTWRAEHPENEKYYKHFKLIWQQSRALASTIDVNENEAWQRFKKRTSERETPLVELNSHKENYFIQIAAAIVVLAGIGWAVYFSMFRSAGVELVTVKADREALTDTLPDGSVVTLNRRSSISYPEGFVAGATRSVTLRGEAFFDVQPDKSKPFVITVNDVTVTVVGTSFNIKSNENTTEVIVETGLVEVEKSAEKVKLKPHEKVTVHKETSHFEKQRSDDELYKYYRTGRLVCNDIPLSEVVAKLSEAYNTRIVIENKKLSDQKFNTTLELKSLSADLHVIRETFSCHIEQSGDTMILK